MINVLFNSVDLSALTNILINNVALESSPERNIMRYPLARSEAQVQVGAFFTNRDITVIGKVIATDENTFQQNRSTLMQNLTAQNANLDIIIGTSVQRFIATMANVIFSDSSGGFGSFVITFKTRDPFGIDPNLAPALAPTTITTQPDTQNLASIGGNYEMLPKITAQLNSGSGFNASTNYMKFTNVVTGKHILITRAFGVAELVEIDCFNKTIQVNRVDTDFSGNILMPFAIGSGGQIKYEDNFTTRNVTLKVEYFKRFI